MIVLLQVTVGSVLYCKKPLSYRADGKDKKPRFFIVLGATEKITKEAVSERIVSVYLITTTTQENYNRANIEFKRGDFGFTQNCNIRSPEYTQISQRPLSINKLVNDTNWSKEGEIPKNDERLKNIWNLIANEVKKTDSNNIYDSFIRHGISGIAKVR